ncbi:site-specific DNA-methyltransferase [Thiothrix subterranea]|uniref:site-specific DNA-methyltransferase n=1 Tax=Thiothrix subterranea TaxID=2735563 RepID=UPI00192B5046|nr:site-specific DNA-methyltransferase [Thiothrix subterranea]QQZ29556.1 site-specific DNA-methyltransferase [Thiothrix subterranea]
MATPDNSTYGKLVDKLRELFELDKADLDFGIYRIISQRQDEVDDFLRNQLKATVSGLLNSAQGSQQVELQAELRKAEQAMQDLGMNPEQSPKVQALREQLLALGNPQRLEDEVYEHLYRFFSRYYEEGDFISLRRVSRTAKYAIPYNGEEVKLHWANADQYYIKSSENFRDYRFTLADGRGVHFKLLDADTSRDNTKGDKRFFVLAGENSLAVHAGELRVHFHYTTTAEKKITDTDGKVKTPSQSVFNNLTLLAIAHDVGKVAPEWLGALNALQPTKANVKRTLLEKHLTDYTAKNSFDYFIHKDLGRFLRQELDFYIKNEVVYLDDIDNPARDGEAEKALTNLQQTLQKITAIRKVAGKVIAFLAQLEDFQKKLWLKKKFVVACDYCLTLDRVPESLYGAIAGNAAQAAEWCKWHFIAVDTVVDERLLRSQPFLMVDTRFYPADFKAALLASIDDIDAQCDGLLINADNFQALNLLQDRYREQVKCIYIDPPYNTGNDGFIYRDNYQHSSWLGLFNSRLQILKSLLSNDSLFYASISDNESANMKISLDDFFGKDKFESQIVVQSNKRGQTYQAIAKTHEYIFVYVSGDNSEIMELPKEISDSALKDADGTYELWELRNRNPKFGRFNRPNLFYPVYVNTKVLDIDGYAQVSLIKTSNFIYETFPRNSNNEDSCWRWGKEKFLNSIGKGNILIAKQKRDGGWNIYEKARKGTTKVKSIWDETDVISEQGTVELGALGFTEFGFPKPTKLIGKILKISTLDHDLVLDYFAGSGTTGHAVINLNREDGGNRKYILVEQGAYFDTVLKPRIQKVVYAENWKDGKPVAKEAGNLGGISHCFKTMRLESYEDTLNNLELKRSGQQHSLLAANPAVKEDYLLHYMLDIEAQGSLLNIDAFTHPFDYQLHIAGDSAGATRPQTVDLVETFNYLLGLSVHTQRTETLQLTCAPNEHGIWQRQKHPDSAQAITATYTFLSIHGTLPDGKTALIIWRILNDFNQPISKTCHNIALDHFLLERQRINPREGELDVIYVNGDNTLPNIRTEAEHWKVRLIEEEFQRLMFAGAV